ncbi:gag-pol polyprotein [Trifolium medium]|uniref:Gag-pol polyprotein n=1 Tax=Trifolium medium TaxID=97028 RepID=A0A392RFB6_9FABA|nr:gag-pol polyprotein [Trifolium medium]
MDEDETISKFNTRLRDIANSPFALGEKMSEEKLVRKTLRSLPKRFNMKVTAIEEAQDLSTIKVDELIGSLQTFEMTFNDRPEEEQKHKFCI